MQGFLNCRQVGQTQFSLDHLDVGDRVHLAGHVNHVVVHKAAHHIDDSVGLADVRQKLVAQTFAGAGAGHQAGDVDKLDNGALHFLRADNGR